MERSEATHNDKYNRIEYEEYFEPYIIANKHVLPRYDERFRGYGMNKISHLLNVAAHGFKFNVLPDVFV